MKMEEYLESELCRIVQLETRGHKYNPWVPGNPFNAYKSQI